MKTKQFPTIQQLTEQAGKNGHNKEEARKIISGVYDYLKRVYPETSKRELIHIAYTIT